jgi:hypothetical protein
MAVAVTSSSNLVRFFTKFTDETSIDSIADVRSVEEPRRSVGRVERASER